MRSTIFTSALIFMANAAAAELPEGCYHRSYSAAHLAGQPQQVVAEITLRIGPSVLNDGEIDADLRILTTDMSRTRAEGVANTTLTQWLMCFDDENDLVGCAVECDGGYMEFLMFDDSELLFSTNYLTVGDREGCGGAIDISEGPGDLTRYLLKRADPARCEGME